MALYDDPLITYDGSPTDAYFNQLLAKVEATPADTVAALQVTTIPVTGDWPTANENADALLARTWP